MLNSRACVGSQGEAAKLERTASNFESPETLNLRIVIPLSGIRDRISSKSNREHSDWPKIEDLNSRTDLRNNLLPIW